jgi:hypothetical protein
MRPIPIPSIAPADYHTFWRLLHPDLPGPYEDWLSQQKQQSESFLARRFGTTEINLNPDEFVSFCQIRHTPFGIEALKEFTEEKALGKRF